MSKQTYTVEHNDIVYSGDITFMLYELNSKDNVHLSKAVFSTVITRGIREDICQLLGAIRFGRVSDDKLEQLFETYLRSTKTYSAEMRLDILNKFAEVGFDTEEYRNVCIDFIKKHNYTVCLGNLLRHVQFATPYTEMLDALSEYYSSGKLATGLTFQSMFDETVNKYSQLVSKRDV